jgi:hypothetical protein
MSRSAPRPRAQQLSLTRAIRVISGDWARELLHLGRAHSGTRMPRLNLMCAAKKRLVPEKLRLVYSVA